MSRSSLSFLKTLGPGLVVAAAGIGAGDVITATVTGARFGTALAWALLACVLLKYALNEGLARWQLATGSTVIEACAQRLPRWVSAYFFLYLLLWTFFVGASLSNACGLAGHSLVPQIPVWAWGVVHSAAAATLVLLGGFGLFERIMKILVGAMVTAVLVCAVLLAPSLPELLRHLVWPALPPGSGPSVLAIFGGIGGSMTMLCYGYWIRENHWSGPGCKRAMRVDLLLAYLVTLVFALALTVVASGCNAVVAQGPGMALEVAARLETVLGPAGRWTFLAGFWCAVFAAMLAVWQGVPYLFADFVTAWRPRDRGAAQANSPSPEAASPEGTSDGAAPLDLKKTRAYRGYLIYLAGPPLVLLIFGRPVAVVVVFAVIGAFFMPFLAALLLYLNNRRDWNRALPNGILHNLALVVVILLFGWIGLVELRDAFYR